MTNGGIKFHVWRHNTDRFQRKRGRESFLLTESEEDGNFRSCHDDCEFPAEDMPTTC